MLYNDWIVGDTARLPLHILDANNVAVDPDSIRLLIKPPGAAIQTIDQPTRLSGGIYRHDLALDKKGTWYYRWEVAAPIPSVVEGAINVQPSRFVQP